MVDILLYEYLCRIIIICLHSYYVTISVQLLNRTCFRLFTAHFLLFY